MSLRGGIVIVLVIALIGWYAMLPPSPRPLTPLSGVAAPARGVMHVHTRRSDGTGTVDQVAAAAQRAGLKFVVFTDHGDGTRNPARAMYLHGVLCIDAVEISTDEGHLVALDVPKAPYPLGGEARDVIEDVHRLGGMAIPAHPGSIKPALRWLDWTSPFEGIEWLNADSEWRDEPPLVLARVLFTYPARGAAALALLLNRPDDVLRRWDTLAARRRITAVAAADAHARFGLRSSRDPYTDNAALPLPSYEEVFRTFSVSLPQAHLSGDAATDARGVIGEIRAGHVYSSIEAIASPASLVFTATSGHAHASGGDLLPPDGPVMLHVASNAPADADVRLLKNGMTIASARGAPLDRMEPGEPAVYRVEVERPDRAGESGVPWILSNPIYVRTADTDETAPPRAAARTTAKQYDNGPASGWTVETSARAKGAIDVVPAVPSGTQLMVRYALAGSGDDSPFVAAAMPAGASLALYDRLTFTAHADRPMRVSVELRIPNGDSGDRWHRSVYLDETIREFTISFDDMRPRGTTATPRPVLADVRSVLFVVDTVNASPGSNGQFWLDEIGYGR